MRIIKPFPLDWPAGWTRTLPAERGKAIFQCGFSTSLDKLLDEIRMLGGTDPVISSNLPTNRRGLPYATSRSADGRVEQVADPGVAVYWTGEKREERVMACDRWIQPGHNIHALALSIAAMRGLERWGSSSIVDKAFAGFAALPSVPEIDWRCELGVPPNATGLEFVRSAYRVKARQCHPDTGGSVEAMSRLNRAWEVAQRELGGSP